MKVQSKPDSDSSYKTRQLPKGVRVTYVTEQGQREAIKFGIEKLLHDFSPSKRGWNYISSISFNSGDGFFPFSLVHETKTALRVLRKIDNPPICGNSDDASNLYTC